MLGKALYRGNAVRILVHDGTIPRAVMILQAINALELEPVQPHVENHIVGHVSHEKLKPEEMVAIHTAFGHLGEASRIWRVMIHQIAWDSVHEKYTEEEKQKLVDKTLKLPDLDKALLKKAEYLAQKKASAEANKAAKERREEAKTKRQASNDHKKATYGNNGKARKSKQDRYYEESAGLRPTSEDTVNFVMSGGKGRFWYQNDKRKGKGDVAAEEAVEATEDDGADAEGDGKGSE